MFNKKNLLILFLTFNLTLSLESTDFCKLEQKVCKGHYDVKQNYQIKCGLNDCPEKFSIKCSINICSNNKTECKVLKQLNSYVNYVLGKQDKINPKIEERNKFIKHTQVCENKIYKYDSNDFCFAGMNCIKRFVSLSGMGYNYVNKKIDCKCPNEYSFKCGKYCTIDSNACDHYKSNENKILFTKINKCSNHL